MARRLSMPGQLVIALPIDWVWLVNAVVGGFG